MEESFKTFFRGRVQTSNFIDSDQYSDLDHVNFLCFGIDNDNVISNFYHFEHCLDRLIIIRSRVIFWCHHLFIFDLSGSFATFEPRFFFLLLVRVSSVIKVLF